MKKKVVILGGGIGGLSVAHKLSKNNNLDITLIEQNNHLGGQAAAKLDSDGNQTELCWHAVSSGYEYFADIMDEIISDDVKLISHLKPLDKFIYAMKDKNYVERTNSFITDFKNSFFSGYKKLYGSHPPLQDIVSLAKIYFYANTISEERLKKYDSILWADYIKHLSPNVKRWILDSTSIYLGMDYSKLSVHFIFVLMRTPSPKTKLDRTHIFYSFDGSMFDVLFVPWKNFLQSKNVKFLMNTQVKKISAYEDVITHIEVCEYSSCDKNKISKIEADVFVNAMDAKNLANLFHCEKYNTLYNNSRQIQTQVLYYLPYRLQSINDQPTVIILPDTPWFLMVRIEGDLWQLEDKDYLSCGIGIWDTKGINGKNALNCTPEELAIECWDQINNSQHNLKLPISVPEWNVWDSFKFNKETGELDTYEPKFSNNINTYAHRPENKDDNYLNLYHATAYVKTRTHIYNMESAAEAGTITADRILKDIFDQEIEKKSQPSPVWYIRIFRSIDGFFMKIFK